jgi:PDDEXK-like uncharacterized protein DUF3799
MNPAWPATPGIYTDMTAAQYFADPAPEPSLTQSIAKVLIERSPAHARLEHPRLNPDYRHDDEAYDKAKAIGNAAHKLMIGRGKEVNIIAIPARTKVGSKVIKSETEIVDATDFRTDDAKQVRDDLLAAGKVPILAKHHKSARDLANTIRGGLDMAGCLDAFYKGHGEVVIVWEEDGIWFRSMIDWMVSPTELYDLKTGGVSAAPHAIPYRMVDQGWDVQAAMQERGLDVLDPASAGRRRFRFVAVENEPPFALTVHELSESVMTMGRKKLQHAVGIWRHCMEHGEWPAYPPLIHVPEYPGFKEAQWLDREMQQFDFVEKSRRAQQAMLTDLSGG